jgi:hypothetical protein
MRHVDESKKKILGLNPVIFVTGLVSLFTDLSSDTYCHFIRNRKLVVDKGQRGMALGRSVQRLLRHC